MRAAILYNIVLLINEFLPNPVGKDTGGEFIELLNVSGESLDISGYFIRDKAGKVFYLEGVLQPGEYLSLNRALTKIAINNSDESIFLYNSKGELLDSASFLGSAREGASFARNGNTFLFTETPTPGEANEYTSLKDFESGLTAQTSGIISLGSISSIIEITMLALIVGTAFAVLMTHLLKNALFGNQ